MREEAKDHFEKKVIEEVNALIRDIQERKFSGRDATAIKYRIAKILAYHEEAARKTILNTTYGTWLGEQLANCYSELDKQRKENEKLQRELKRYKAMEKLFGWDKDQMYYEKYHALASIIEQVKELVDDA